MLSSAASVSGFRIEAPAKINLYLHVLGRRDDGYHLLDSLIAFAAVHDVVTVRHAEVLSLSIDGPFAGGLPDGDNNLVLRAARSLAPDETTGAVITLTKNLPVAAGIGGGSADAAAALLALAALWRIDDTAAELARIGIGLGADVPACLNGSPLYVGGIGEEIEPAPELPPMGVLLVNPMVPLSTEAVFSKFGDGFTRAARLGGPWTDAPDFAAELASRRNDLTGPAGAVEPAIASVLSALDEHDTCLLARLSGSGPTCFGLFGNEAEAIRAGEKIAASHTGWWVCPTLFRSEPPVVTKL